jgi:hypothetical protein
VRHRIVGTMTTPSPNPAPFMSSLLAAVLMPVALLPLATAAHAQADDKAYCTQLVDLYRRYVQNSPGRGFDVEASRALDDCRKGNPEGIPVLEKKLRENKITPPGGGEFKP